MSDGNTAAAALAGDIAAWLRRQLDESGAQRFVLGLSGGVDSATVCALCVRATGPEHVLAVIMPAHSNPTDAEDAELVARTFGVETVRVDLTPVTDAFLAAMPGDGGQAQSAAARLAAANVRPRLRMTTLYYLGNLRNGIIVGTGNKSEALIGYFTKYGDGGVDILPIADLYKREVRELARVLGVPERVIEKPPSAGLWQGQTDEGEIGLTYADLDAALPAIEQGDTSGIAPRVLNRIERMMRASAHKRRPIPVYRRDAAVVSTASPQ